MERKYFFGIAFWGCWEVEYKKRLFDGVMLMVLRLQTLLIYLHSVSTLVLLNRSWTSEENMPKNLKSTYGRFT
ncbi:unnamed protein product [Coffea canephora]|uniref:Uncharacterized protein n=1 Tax=Coffea canephora TaxID=49390 RepID=A0A068V641_COFCA|nr:unnamed protein product [Coffea canephora]